jgi:hypothetical protein
MVYRIASERVGKIGDVFDADAAAAEGINVPALIDGGFVVEESKKSKKAED